MSYEVSADRSGRVVLAWVSGPSFDEIAGSKPAGGMDISF
jgi:hypothetical protein